MSAPAVITAPQTAEEILKGFGSAARSVASSAASASSYTSSYVSSYATAENGSYTLNVLFYLVLYAFILFLVLVVVHFTITPVFKFTPGAKGLIGVSASSDDKVYWNEKAQPLPLVFVPPDPLSTTQKVDPLSAYPFINSFSFSVDLYVRRMTDTTATNRVILYKTYKNGSNIFPAPTTAVADPLATAPAVVAPATEVDIGTYMQKVSSMFMYLTQTNDLVVTFFTGSDGTPISTRQVKNIPLYVPFRVTVVVEQKSFTVYINAKQAFQRTVPSTLSLNSSNSLPTDTTASPQRFFAPPAWADLPTKTVFLQNFHLWPRAISYPEVQTAQPALALVSDFNMPVESGSGSCNT
jgi:hypothetical protein